MSYNLTRVENVTNIYDFIRYTNTDLTGGYGFSVFAFILYLILFLAFSKYGVKNALVTSSFISAFMFTLLSFAGLIKFEFIFIPLIFGFAGLIIKLFFKE